MSGGGAPSGMACQTVADCPKGGFACKQNVCTCPVNTPDVCGTGADASCAAKAMDPNNCGECGTKCEAGAACVAGMCGATPKDLTTSAGCGAIRLAIQGKNLVWTESKLGKVRSMPLAGGAPTDLAMGRMSPSQIAVDDAAVYWIEQADVAGMSKIYKQKGAAAPVAMKTATVGAMDKIAALAVAGGKLYYTLGFNIHAISSDETSNAADVIVGTAINKDFDPPVESGDPSGLAVSDKLIVWTTGNRQGVEGDDLAAGSTGYVELGQSQGGLLLQDIALDATYGYWANGPNIVRNKLTAATPIPDPAVTSTPGFDPITAFAINATNVYAGAEMGLLLKHSLLPPTDPNDEKTIVPPDVIARDQTAPSSIVLDSTSVYWATTDTDCVIRSTPL
jgi:hypothetical protein